MDRLCKETIYLIATFWRLKAKSALTKAVSKPKAMKISLEFPLGWPSQLIEDRIRQILKMRRRKMTLITTSWRSQNYSKVTLSRTTCSATQQTSLCGLSTEAETLAEWVLTSQPCIRQDRNHSVDPAMPTLKKMVQSRRVSNSSGRGQEGIAHLFQVISLRCLSRQRMVTTLLEVMESSKTICTTMVRLSKFGRICLRRRHSLQLCTYEDESIHLEVTMLMTRCSWTCASTMTWSWIGGITRPSSDRMVQLSSNCTNNDRRAAAVSLKRLWSTYLEGIVAILAPYHALKNLISPRRRW